MGCDRAVQYTHSSARIAGTISLIAQWRTFHRHMPLPELLVSLIISPNPSYESNGSHWHLP